MTYALDASVRALAAAIGDDMGEVKPNVRKANFTADRAPLPSDDETQGYAVGSRWLWQGQEWVAAGVAAGAARWVRPHSNGTVTPDQFGARSYTTASGAVAGIDSAAAVQAAIDTGYRVALGGYYRCDAAITASGAVSITGEAISGLVFTAATDGIVITQSSQADETRLSGFDILTTAQEPGDALRLDYSAATDTPQRRNQHSAIISNMRISGVDYLSAGWARGVVMDEVQSPVLRDVFICGRRDTAASGEAQWWPGLTEGVYFLSSQDRSPTDPLFDSVDVRYAAHAFRCAGVLEGVRLTHCLAVACRDGVYDDRTELLGEATTDPWLSVSNCHFNVSRYGIKTFRVYQGFINNNLIYRFKYFDAEFIGITLDTGSDWQISGNHINGRNNIGLLNPSTGVSLKTNHRAKVHSTQCEFCDIPGIVADMDGARLYNNVAQDEAGPQQFWTYSGSATPYSNPAANYSGIVAEGKTGSSVTFGAVTVIQLVTLNNAPAGSVFKVYAQAVVTKGATSGATRLLVNKGAGTATFSAAFDATEIDVQNESQAASSEWRVILSGFVKKTSAGTLSIAFRGTSAGSDATIAAGKLQYVIEQVR